MKDNVAILESKSKSLNFYKIKRNIYFTTKNIIDFNIALVGCMFLLPLIVIVKIAYLVSGDKYTIFYKQKRIGKDGKTFYIYKFRSMVYNAEEVLQQILQNKEFKKEWDTNQKLEKDERITKVGKILRKTSLDEMPQFINVLMGNMSLIGPRPLVEGELDAHGGEHELYESVKPGISGWWAANGRSTTTYKERLELEYYYINNCGFLVDFKCIIKTIQAVLCKTGAK